MHKSLSGDITATADEVVETIIREHVEQVDPLAEVTRWSEMVKHLSLDALDLYEIQYKLSEHFDIDLPCIEATNTVADVIRLVEACIMKRTGNE